MLQRDTLFRECLAEFIGIFFFMFIGTGCVAALIFMKNYSSFWELSCIWGFAVACGIYISGGVSGAHMNPAVTIAFALTRGFPKKKIAPYILAQIAGAAVGALLTYILYSYNFGEWEATNNIMRGSAQSQVLASIFTTYPQPYLSLLKAGLIEACITAILMMVIMAVSDPKNPAAPGAMIGALVIGGTITIIGASFGALTGFAMNPARDFGPRIFLFLAGWGQVALPGPGGYFLVPIIAPIVGAIGGAALYQRVINRAFIRQEQAQDAVIQEELIPTESEG